MSITQTGCYSIINLSPCPKFDDFNLIIVETANHQRRKHAFTLLAAKSGFSIPKKCKRCGGQGAIECPGCKGTGKNKKNGNIFERWKCFECQGFGLKSCPVCGKGGLTPEQRGER